MPAEYIPPLLHKNDSKIVLLVMDGLGGLPIEPGGPTELEAASTPVMDHLAAEGTLGQTIPIRPGVTPGSGPAHLALFGYDPIVHEIGRGTLEAVGVGMQVRKGDVAARGNFCTLDAHGKITDRRAGRISTPEALPVVEKLKKIEIPGVATEVRHVKEYRFAVVIRGEGLHPEIDDTDPQTTGVPPLPARASSPAAEYTAGLYNQWIARAQQVISDQPMANGLTLRGFATHPGLVSYEEAYGLRAACVAVYPMYRGVSRLVGMDTIEFEGEAPPDRDVAFQVRRLVHTRAIPRDRRLPRASQGARDVAGRRRRRGQEIDPVGSRRGRLPCRRQMGIDARRCVAALPRGQRRRERAGHLQGPPADGTRPAPADRGQLDRLLRGRAFAVLPLHPGRDGRRPRARRQGARRGLCGRLHRSEHPGHELRCRHRVALGCRRLRGRRGDGVDRVARGRAWHATPQAPVLPGRDRAVRHADDRQQRRDAGQPSVHRRQRIGGLHRDRQRDLRPAPA